MQTPLPSLILLESTIIPEIISAGTNIITKNIDIEPLFFRKNLILTPLVLTCFSISIKFITQKLTVLII